MGQYMPVLDTTDLAIAGAPPVYTTSATTASTAAPVAATTAAAAAVQHLPQFNV